LFLVSLARSDCSVVGAKVIEEEMSQWTNKQVALGHQDAAGRELLVEGAE
jgi:hypothetical protein